MRPPRSFAFSHEAFRQALLPVTASSALHLSSTMALVRPAAYLSIPLPTLPLPPPLPPGVRVRSAVKEERPLFTEKKESVFKNQI